MGLQEIIQTEIKNHLEEFKLNTVKLRDSKVHGVAGATIYNIIHSGYIPSKKTIEKLLKGFGYTYKIAFEGFREVKKKQNEDHN